jgi:hypothetical protein
MNINAHAAFFLLSPTCLRYITTREITLLVLVVNGWIIKQQQDCPIKFFHEKNRNSFADDHAWRALFKQ